MKSSQIFRGGKGLVTFVGSIEEESYYAWEIGGNDVGNWHVD